MSSITRRALLAGLALAGAVGVYGCQRRQAATEQVAGFFADPLAAPKGALNVYHLGHSLVGHDMPAMLAQMVAGHRYNSQLGWGTSLRHHWEPDVAINGFAESNTHLQYRDAHDGVSSGQYDAVVLTEMVEIADALRYHDSPTYLANWAKQARKGRQDARVYLYETWHHTDDPKGWLARIDQDLPKFWQGKIATPAMIAADAPIYLIPAGQVMAAVLRAGQNGQLEGIAAVDDLFAKQPDGTPDTIHFNDIGAYLVALTHFAVLYHRTPVGLPHQLKRADGTPANALSPVGAAQMQEIVWNVVRAHPETGVAR